jgi:hypothetical protein
MGQSNKLSIFDVVKSGISSLDSKGLGNHENENVQEDKGNSKSCSINEFDDRIQ